MPVCLQMMSPQVEGLESHQKPWYDTTFRLDLDLCLEMRSIAELGIHLNERMRLNMPNHLLDKFKAVRSPG